MDLSHWDAVTFFSRDQIVHLLAGVDPNGGAYPPIVENKIKLYRKLISVAIDNALEHACEHVRGLTERPDVIAPDIFEYDPWDDELPSLELRRNVGDVLEDPKNVSILRSSDPLYTEQFHCADIHCWATKKGLTKGYRFDGIANDRITDPIWHPPFDPRSNLNNLESAFEAQLEALIERYLGFADHLKPRRDVEELNRIGSWQRIAMLDRMEDGEEFLAMSDRVLLRRVGESGAVGYVLDDDDANREWRAASYQERWVAFGVHVYCRIIGGKTSTEEAVFLFRLASEMVGFLERGDTNQSQEDLLAQNARAAANARHSKPGGSRDKRRQIRAIWSTGKYSSRDICAEQECAALGMSFSSARKALRGTPDPT